MEGKEGFWGSLTAIALAIVGVATLAVVVSKNGNTTNVISATSSAFTTGLATALSPITGSGAGNSLSSFPIS